MDNLPRQIIAEAANVEAVLKNLQEAMDRKVKTVVELAANRYAYGFMLEEAPLESLVDNLPGIWEKFISEVAQNICGDR